MDGVLFEHIETLFEYSVAIGFLSYIFTGAYRKIRNIENFHVLRLRY